MPVLDHYDVEEVARIKLNADAMEMAAEGANDYAHAGKDEYDQLEQGIRAYIYAVQALKVPGAKVARRDHVPLPLTVEDAKWMIEMGQKFLATQLLEPPEFDGCVKIP